MTVRTRYTGLSAGTELSFLTGTNPHCTSSFDPELGLFRTDLPGTGYPVERLGYMEVGRVDRRPRPGFAVGDLVAMTFGHRTGYTADPLRDLIVPLPPDLDPMLGIWWPTWARSAPTASCTPPRRCAAAVRALGDGVAGGGSRSSAAAWSACSPALFARHHGAARSWCSTRPRCAGRSRRRSGLTALPDEDDVAVTLKSRWRHGAGDRGADVVFQCRGPQRRAGAWRCGCCGRRAR